MLASGRSLGFNAGWPGGFTQGSERGLQLGFGCQVISRLLSLPDSPLSLFPARPSLLAW